MEAEGLAGERTTTARERFIQIFKMQLGEPFLYVTARMKERMTKRIIRESNTLVQEFNANGPSSSESAQDLAVFLKLCSRGWALDPETGKYLRFSNGRGKKHSGTGLSSGHKNAGPAPAKKSFEHGSSKKILSMDVRKFGEALWSNPLFAGLVQDYPGWDATGKAAKGVQEQIPKGADAVQHNSWEDHPINREIQDLALKMEQLNYHGMEEALSAFGKLRVDDNQDTEMMG
jgi:hypothetical protein